MWPRPRASWRPGDPGFLGRSVDVVLQCGHAQGRRGDQAGASGEWPRLEGFNVATPKGGVETLERMEKLMTLAQDASMWPRPRAAWRPGRILSHAASATGFNVATPKGGVE